MIPLQAIATPESKPALPGEIEVEASAAEQRIYTASQSQLIWWRFRKHKLAMIGGVVLILLYLLAIFCEFISPYTVSVRHEDIRVRAATDRPYPPAGRHVPHPVCLWPDKERDPETYRWRFREDRDCHLGSQVAGPR